MFHVKHFSPVKSLMAACRGADWRGGGGGWLLTGRRLMATRQGGGWIAHRAAVGFTWNIMN